MNKRTSDKCFPPPCRQQPWRGVGRPGSWAVGGQECSRAQRETLTATARFSPERKINIPESIKGFFFPVCSSYVKPGSEWPLEGEREKKRKLMPNFFICVLLPRVVPPNQYTIHKYPRAPCSRQSGDESLRVSLLHTSWLPEGGEKQFSSEAFNLIVQSVLRKAGFSLKSLVLCILLSWIQWSRISYFNKKKSKTVFELCAETEAMLHMKMIHIFLTLWTAFKNSWVEMLASMWNHWKRCSTDASLVWRCKGALMVPQAETRENFTVLQWSLMLQQHRGLGRQTKFRTGLLTLTWKGINAPCDITMGFL